VAHIIHGTLAANVVTTVTLDQPYELIEVVNRNAAGEIYFRLDGTTPTVGGTDCQVVPAIIGSVSMDGITTANTTVLLISSAACNFTVSGT